MLIVGCDYHPSIQQIAFVDTETGDYGERRLKHSGGKAEKFYRDLKLRGVNVRVGLEATGHTRWFERLLSELGCVRKAAVYESRVDLGAVRKFGFLDLRDQHGVKAFWTSIRPYAAASVAEAIGR
jgi:hypothetical protein